MQMGGGGLVPLSHAICCRPCVPGELPPEPLRRAGLPEYPDTKPLAVVSIGCHPSSGRAYRALTCESNGASFITGTAGTLFTSPPLLAVQRTTCIGLMANNIRPMP